MSVERQQNIVQLKIAVYDPVLVEVLQSQADLGSVEPEQSAYNLTKDMFDLLGALGAKLAALDMPHEIASVDVFHHKVYPRLSLETCVEI